MPKNCFSLNEKQKNVLLVVFCAAAIVALLSFLEPGYGQICDTTKGESPPNCPSYNVIAYSFWRFVGVTNYYGNAVTAFATVLLAIITYRLVSLGREQSITARTQLRAYVKLSHESPGVNWQDSDGRFKVALKITNYGKTPARITDVVTNFFLPPLGMKIDELPPSVRHGFPKETRGFLTGPDDPFWQHIDMSVEPSEQVALVAGQIGMILYGYVDYIDQFGVRYRGGYGRKFDRNATVNNLVFPDSGPFNYDRERDPGEGLDWDEK